MAYKIKNSITLLICLLISNIAATQSIEGSWEGKMNDEILQVNIVKNDNMLCGFTYDYRIEVPDDHCRAYFSGSFSSTLNAWILQGTRFFENSGTHILMEIRLREEVINGKTMLRGIVFPKQNPEFSGIINYIEVLLEKTKISSGDLSAIRKACFPTPKELKKQQKKNEEKSKPKQDTTLIREDEISELAPVDNKVIATEVEQKLLEDMGNRKKNEFSKLKVTTRNIKIKVYDNGIIDNDTVSIFYNNRLLINHQKLSEKPIEIDLQLDENTSIHELSLFAENLGSIPPNTALVVVTAGDKRYELFASASLDENAVLRFEYDPKN